MGTEFFLADYFDTLGLVRRQLGTDEVALKFGGESGQPSLDECFGG